jgi:simple sugar transport system permease protein
LAVGGLLGFGLSAEAGETSLISIATGAPGLGSPSFELPTLASVIVLGLIQLALAGWAWRRASQRAKAGIWLPAVFGVALVISFLLWAVAGRGYAIQFTSLLSGALFLSVPLVFGALAGCVCEHVGVINVAIEGQLLAGAFLAAVVGSATGNPWLGLICAPLAGALVGALLALFAVRYWVDHIIVGIVLNVLVTGLTSYLFSTVLSNNTAVFSNPTQLPRWPIPLLSQIPVLGPVLFDQNVLVYLMYIAVAAFHVMLFKSRWGLRMRACGEHPKAADTVGIKVNATRIRNTILGGAVAGLGGAYFTVAAGLAFGKEMSAGRGFIALAAMILGGWKPKGAILAALLFGFADNLQNALGVVGVAIPSQFMLMAPYLVTVFAVAGLVGRVRAPAAEGVAYKG